MSLHDLQTTVHVAKDKENSFGGYNYRTAEGILAAAKAALPKGATIVVSDCLAELAGQIFVSATATVTFADGAAHSATGHAMHPLTKKGMDPSQITGAASSYARKYALAGLLALDDGSSDPDASKAPYVATVTGDQFVKLRDMTERVGADMPRFLKTFDAASLQEFPADKFAAAMAALEKKAKRAPAPAIDDLGGDSLPY